MSSDTAIEPRLGLQNSIWQDFKDLIKEQHLPYKVTKVEFQDASAADVAGSGLPPGTALWVEFDDAHSAVGRYGSAKKVLFLDPLRLYADAIRPHVGDMAFAVVYLLKWNDASSNTFVIHPSTMRLYLNGDITLDQLGNKIEIYGR